MIIRENVSISELSTMRIGGIARFVFELENEFDIEKAREECEKRGITKYYFLGLGANTFATDDKFDGVILINKYRDIKIEELPTGSVRFTVGGGVKWDDFVDETTKLGLTGVECLAGIPGSVGAAPVQNIGAYGQEAKDTISRVFVFDFKTGESKWLDAADCNFSYRRSIFNGKERGKYFIIKVEFELKRGEIDGPLYNSLQAYLADKGITSREPKILADAVRKVRDTKLPDPEKIASSGSFFKNIYVDESEIEDLDRRGIPHHGNKVNTGWLIEQSGIKGRNFYGFKISDKAALVLINESGKSYADMQKAVAEISKIVEEKFGFKLEQEPNVIGKEDIK